MNNNELDRMIVEDMTQTEDNNHYRRYITDRFEVVDMYEAEERLCAVILDHETKDKITLHNGDTLADGRVNISEDGVIFEAPRADVGRFALRSSMEMSPLKSDSSRQQRHHLDEILRQEQMNMPMEDETAKMIIIMSPDHHKM